MNVTTETLRAAAEAFEQALRDQGLSLILMGLDHRQVAVAVRPEYFAVSAPVLNIAGALTAAFAAIESPTVTE